MGGSSVRDVRGMPAHISMAATTLQGFQCNELMAIHPYSLLALPFVGILAVGLEFFDEVVSWAVRLKSLRILHISVASACNAYIRNRQHIVSLYKIIHYDMAVRAISS